MEVDRKEYNRLVDLGHENNMNTYTEEFIQKFPKYKGKEDTFDEWHKEMFAYLKKGEDGYCELLDRETMLCSIYTDRPKVCMDYTTDKCGKIRLLKEEG